MPTGRALARWLELAASQTGAVALAHQLSDLALGRFALRPVLADVLDQRRVGDGVDHRVVPSGIDVPP